jgi:molecular chaperone DnaK (HSP70)
MAFLRRVATLVVACVLLFCVSTHAANVVGIDFGSEWIKAAYIKSGEKTGVSIVLDPASARKFPNTMAFSSSERFFGLVAAGKGHLHYPHLRQLLGKSYNPEYFAKYGQFYFPYGLNAAGNGRTEIVNSANSSETLSPEELVASILRYV